MVYVLCRTFPLWIFRKKWWVMAVANVLGFYTHTYMIFVPIAQGIHWLCSRHRVIKFLHASALTILLMLPWFFRVIREMPKLKNTWYFPVDIHLVQSVLGNMFIGYEGTPWFLWNVTAYLSLGLLALFLFSLEPKTTQPRNLFLHTMTCSRSPWSSAFPFQTALCEPLSHPCHDHGGIFSCVCHRSDTKSSRPKTFALLFAFAFGFNVWYPSQHAKIDIRKR